MPAKDANPGNKNRNVFHANMMNKKGSSYVFHKSTPSPKTNMVLRSRKPLKVTPIHGSSDKVLLEARPALPALNE